MNVIQTTIGLSKADTLLCDAAALLGMNVPVPAAGTPCTLEIGGQYFQVIEGFSLLVGESLPRFPSIEVQEWNMASIEEGASYSVPASPIAIARLIADLANLEKKAVTLEAIAAELNVPIENEDWIQVGHFRFWIEAGLLHWSDEDCSRDIGGGFEIAEMTLEAVVAAIESIARVGGAR